MRSTTTGCPRGKGPTPEGPLGGQTESFDHSRDISAGMEFVVSRYAELLKRLEDA